VIAAVGCGPGARGTGGGDGTDGGGGGDSGGDVAGGDNCSESAKLVYTLDANNTFSKFDASTQTFTDLGTLSCPTGPLYSAPYSMGIDRNTIAWVLYTDGQLYRVDIQNNLACTKTLWVTQNFSRFGMGFSSDVAGGNTDTLFIAGATGTGAVTLAKLDTTSMNTTTVGTVQGSPELTGTGSAQLWGWFPNMWEPYVEQLDKTNGSVIKTYLLPSLAGMPEAYAFAFWGGDFWVFLEKGSETSTTVYQIDGMTGAIKGSTPTGTREIVGAGVSSCAPVVIQ
jgi:hypothetical protein